MRGGRVRKIAFWRTVRGAYRFVFTSPGLLIRLIWPASGFLVILIPLYFFRASPLLAVPFLALGYLFLIAVATMAGLAFNRAVLLNERKWLAVRFHWPHWRFLGVSFVIVLVMSLPSHILGAIISGFLPESARIGLSPLMVIVIGWSVVVFTKLVLWSAVGRLMLALPAIALGEGSGIFARAWQRSKGNAWRLLLGWAVCWMPLQLLPEIVSRTYYLIKQPAKTIVFDDSSLYGTLLSSTANSGMDLLSTCLAMAFYAYSYAQLAHSDLAQALAAARLARQRGGDLAESRLVAD